MKMIDKVRTRQVTHAIRLVRPIICSTSIALILVATSAAAEKVAPNSESTGKSKTKVEQENKSKTTAPTTTSQESKEVITGSYIPQKAKRHGSIAETTSPVYVIDRRAIDQTGATTISQVLRRRVTSVR